MAKIKIAIVDLDGTLVPESARLRAQATAVLPYFETLDIQEFIYRFFAVNDWVAAHAPTQKNHLPYYFTRLAEQYAVSLPPPTVSAVTALWQQAYDTAPVRPFPDAVHFLATLKARGYQVIVASGGTRSSREQLLTETALAPYVDGLLAAAETGFQKQQAEFWDELINRFPVLQSEAHIVMVGNQWNDDGLHPHRLGYKVFMVRWPGELEKVRGERGEVWPTAGVPADTALVGASLTELLSQPELQ